MNNLLQEHQVLYVEPNAINDFTSYNDTTYKSPDLEDLCIVVDLSVEVKGRTYNGSTNSNSENLTLEWQSSVVGQSVNFMKGSKIYTDSSKTSYVNSLTTSYTDIHLKDIEKHGTAEMFGIKSIDISYNNFMVPEVTIQFVDVRGVSLFAQEELRHNLSSNGITATANNNIEGSFFKCFFTFPYPKFTLKVKGFYGKMTSYELTCSDFRAAFDSNTGNFNVTAKFIGYAFSFLGDVMVNALVAAPYSEYEGKSYWESHLDNTFKVTDKNGAEVPMVKLGDLCKKFKQIQEAVNNRLSEEGAYAEEAANLGMNQDVQDALVNEDLSELRTKYNELVDTLNSIAADEVGEAKVTTDSSSSVFFAINESVRPAIRDEIGEVVDAISGLNKTLKSEETKDKYPSIKTWAEGGNKIKANYYYYFAIFDNNTYQVKDNVIEDEELIANINSKSSENAQGDKSYKSFWEGGITPSIAEFPLFGGVKGDTYIFLVYEDGGLQKLLRKSSQLSGEELIRIKDDIRSTMMQNMFSDTFSFAPTVENVTKIIMAHFETYVHMISTCANNIIEAGTSRSVSNLGIDLKNFPDAKGNSSKIENSNVVLAPFPKVTKVVNQENIEKTEDTWLGEFGDSSKFEEIRFIDGILDGIAEAAEALNYTPMYNNANNNDGLSPIKYPITFFDLYLDSGDNVFGDLNVTHLNDIFARFCVRAICVLTAHTDLADASAKKLGEIDAKNFIAQYASAGGMGVLKEALSSGKITNDFLYNYVSNKGETPEGVNSNVAWPKNGNLIAEGPSGKFCFLTLGKYKTKSNKSGYALPIRNWSFTQWAKDFPNETVATNQTSQYVLSEPYSDEFNDSSSLLYVIKSKGYEDFKRRVAAVDDYSDSLQKWFTKHLVADEPQIKAVLKAITFGTVKNKTIKAEDVQYDDNFVVTNSDSIVIDTSCMLSKDYYSKASLVDKAKFFLENIFPVKNLRGNTLDIYNHIKPKILALYCGAHTENAGAYRYAIKKQFQTFFEDWVNTTFKIYDEAFTFKFKEGKNIDGLQSAIAGKTLNVQDTKKLLEKYIDFEHFSEYYEEPEFTNGVFYFWWKSGKVMSALVEDICSCCATISIGNFNRVGGSANLIGVKKSDFKDYLGGVIEGLKEELDITQTTDSTDTSNSTDNTDSSATTGSTDESTATTTIAVDGNTDDIKVGVYNYTKMLYDKWIASGETMKDYNMDKMFYAPDHTFHFIDSFYNKIGKQMFLNIGTVVDLIYNCQTQNGFTLLSMLSSIYSSNKFLFLCIQNFVDLSKRDNIEKMFKPLPYIETERPDNHPDFVVLYPYEASSKLDVPGAEYPDDTFYLNDSTTWPTMITSKQPTDPAIPAFGVSYGQQYQNYFKNVQVDMNTPMVTEQSIKAKFMICGAGNGAQNNGPRITTVGQDLYTIYSNNSYTCQVTMMGCAWVQPMMYFVLQNVPMFRGSYLIVKVNHQITPGNMVTTFTGVRMAATATRSVKEFVYGNVMSSSDGSVDSATFAANNANVGNDCEWAYNDPTGSSVGVANVDGLKLERTGNPLNAEQIANVKKWLPLMQSEGKKLNYNIPWTILPIIADVESSWTNANIYEGDTSTKGAKGIGQFMYRTAKDDKYKNYFKIVLQGLSVRDDRCDPNKAIPCMVIAVNAWANEVKTRGYRNVLNDVKKLVICLTAGYNGGTDSLVACCKILNTQSIPSVWGHTGKSETDKYIKMIYNGLYKYGSTSTSSQSASSSSDKDDLSEGFRRAVESSINTSESYSNVSVTKTDRSNGWILLTASGSNGNNALFDCILQTYSRWWSQVSFGCNQSKVSGEPYGVHVKLSSSESSSNQIFVFNKDDNKTIELKNESDVNDGLKKSMIKYFRGKGITTIDKAKVAFRSIASMSDNDIKKVFELGGTDNSVIQSCNSLMGAIYSYSPFNVDLTKINGCDFSGIVTNPNMKKVLKDVCHYYWYSVYAHVRGSEVGGGQNLRRKCTFAPFTWYRQAGIEITFWGPFHYTKSRWDATKKNMEKVGFISYWHGSPDTLRDKVANKEITTDFFRPGDIATMHAYSDGCGTSHACMWTGKDWRSDFVQTSRAQLETLGVWVYGHSKGRFGENSIYLWRKNDWQEPNTYTTSSTGSIGSSVGSSVVISSDVRKANSRANRNGKLQALFGGAIPKYGSNIDSYLTRFTVPGRDENGNPITHTLRMHKDLVNTIKQIFQELYDSGFYVTRVGEGGCSGWRRTKGGNISNHSYGVAVDINPTCKPKLYETYNPWYNTHIRMDDRSTWTKGENTNIKIRNWDSIAVKIFGRHGFGWGGSYGDTMHFSYLGGG